MSPPTAPPSDERAMQDEELHRHWSAGDYDQVVTLMLKWYGAELLGFVVARVRDADDAQDVFSTFLEDLWKGLPGFGWRCSLRGWCYALARNAANRSARSPHKRRAQPMSFSSRADIAALVAHARTTTAAFLQTQTKSRMQLLRERLAPEDQAILMLRLDRGLAWRDLAVAIAESELDQAELEREAARVRKRFSIAKERLRELATEEGLL
jgi:RNA polymerase sigma-70 factor (ECF subfamily)